MLRRLCLLCIAVFYCASIVSAQGEHRSTEESITRWQASRFGLFIHWGPVGLKGTEIGWSRGGQVPVAEYDQLYRQFNPTGFDADAWVKTAKEAGKALPRWKRGEP